MTLIGGLAIAWPLASYAQPLSTPLKRVALLSEIGCPIAPDNGGRRRLAELGWVEGRNFVFDCVSPISRSDQIPALARELVTLRPDVLIAGPWQYVTALKRETTTIPIVMLGTWDHISWGTP